jgi:hypothetical protein
MLLEVNPPAGKLNDCAQSGGVSKAPMTRSAMKKQNLGLMRMVVLRSFAWEIAKSYPCSFLGEVLQRYRQQVDLCEMNHGEGNWRDCGIIDVRSERCQSHTRE